MMGGAILIQRQHSSFKNSNVRKFSEIFFNEKWSATNG